MAIRTKPSVMMTPSRTATVHGARQPRRPATHSTTSTRAAPAMAGTARSVATTWRASPCPASARQARGSSSRKRAGTLALCRSEREGRRNAVPQVAVGQGGHAARGERGDRGPQDAHPLDQRGVRPVSYTHLRAHETRHDLVCRLLLEKKKKKTTGNDTS